MTAPTSIIAHRVERILAFMFIGLIALSVVCFIAVITATALGVGANDDFSKGLWPVVLVLPLIALPSAFCLLIALLVVNGVRRARTSRAS